MLSQHAMIADVQLAQATAGKRRAKINAVSEGAGKSAKLPRSIGETPESLANWLADSRPAWNQLIATLRIKRQSKSRNKQNDY